MGSGKWIGGFLGLMGGGPIGALGGYILGSLYDLISDSFSSDSEGANSGERNSFLMSLMILSADVIQSDGRIMHSEMEYLRTFLRMNFGESSVKEGEAIILKLFERRKQIGDQAWKQQIDQCCAQISRSMRYEQRLQLLRYLVEVAKADGTITKEEKQVLYNISSRIGVGAGTIDQFMGLGGSTLEDAYKVLGISSSATDDEVRKAYKQMALKHHPDHVTNLGEDIRKDAEEKFKEINDAKDRIYRARGMK